MKRLRTLSASFVRTVKEPGRYGDGHGGYGLSLFVKVLSSGRLSKTWSQRIRIHGRITNLGLGRYPIVTLAEARVKALENLRATAKGHDPRGGGIPTFAQAAEKVIAMHRSSWKPGGRSEQQWRDTLQRWVIPTIGRKRVDLITMGDVMDVLLADDFWNQRHATARQVRQRIGTIMKWAVANGYRVDNPAGDAIAAALPKNNGRVRHHRALPHGKVAAALAKVRDSSVATPPPKLALEFLALTACRSAEVRGATWEEVDEKRAVWIIPSGRMKTKRTHRVPLSARALEVLAEARPLANGSELVFPGRTGRPLNGKTLSALTSGLGCVPHGFRTSFRNWCGETGVPREVAERCLAHVVKSQVERAYSRTDLLERRREVMEAWAQYVTE